jgi:dihydrofolate reductase
LKTAQKKRGDMMGKVLVHATLSLDGFMAGPNDEMDWMFKYIGPNEIADQVIKATGAVVMGRRTYNIANKGDGFEAAYGGLRVPHFVLTHRVPDTTPKGFEITFVTESIESALAKAKAAAGDKNVSVLGAHTAQQCIQAGLVDDIQLHLTPVLLGRGVRMFEHVMTSHIELERTRVVESSRVTDLRFRIVK